MKVLFFLLLQMNYVRSMVVYIEGDMYEDHDYRTK
jgi:hypothetical protein